MDIAAEMDVKLSKQFQNLSLSNGYHSNQSLVNATSLSDDSDNSDSELEFGTSSQGSSTLLCDEINDMESSLTCDEGLFDDDDTNDENEANGVTLPPRFRTKPCSQEGEQKEEEEGEEEQHEGENEEGKTEETTDLTDDINIAIQWIKNEITRMKTQDQKLMRQFKYLRTTISALKHSRRKLPSLAVSCQSLPNPRCQSLSISSCQSLDLGALNRDWSPASERDVFLDFNVAMQPASSPCTPNRERDVISDFASTSKLNTSVWNKSSNKSDNSPVWYV